MTQVELLDHTDAWVAAQICELLLRARVQEAAVVRANGVSGLEPTCAEIQASPDFYMGAIREGRLVGVASVRPDDEPAQINVAMLAVDPAQQRQGIGRALVLDAIRRGDGAALSVSCLGLNVPALALYAELGFVVYRHGSLGKDALAMVKLRRVPVPARSNAGRRATRTLPPESNR